MSEKDFKLRVIEGGGKTCPQCHSDINKGEEFFWYGTDFCSERCGRDYFRRKGSRAA